MFGYGQFWCGLDVIKARPFGTEVGYVLLSSYYDMDLKSTPSEIIL